MQIWFAAGGTGLTFGAVIALWQGWRRPRADHAEQAAAVLLLAAAAGCWIMGYGAEIGIPLLLESMALVGFGFILTRIERRPDRTDRGRVGPVATGRRRIARGVAMVAVAGPLGFAAAIGIAVAIATRAPLAEQTRLIGAGLLVPSLWAVFVGWTLMARRLPVPAAGMAVLAGAGFGLALLGQG